MTDDAESSSRPVGDEAFFARWSRRKRQKPSSEPHARLEVGSSTSAQPGPSTARAPPDSSQADTPPTDTPGVGQPVPPDARVAAKPLTEADFDDVDFDALTYGSDYGRFMQPGVPEGIRQKALTKLWHSDSMFTAVDPFQDYAGDYTDAATVPKSGIVKTAYKVGQGFLTDEEAHVWHRLGKPPLPAETLAMAVLVPGVRVRPATPADGAALLAVHTSAIVETAGAHLGPELAASWAFGLSPEGYGRAIARGEAIEVAIDEDTGEAVAFAGTDGSVVTAAFVHARRTRKGLGRAMLRRAVEAVSNRGFARAQLEAEPGARAFYEAQGFAVRATRSMTSRGGLMMDVLDMEKLLTAPPDLVIARETPDQPEVRAFFAASEAYASALYPAESNHFVDLSVLMQPDVMFLVARSADRALGCAAIVKAGDGTAEIKRMWVSPEARGLGLGKRLLDALVGEAQAAGVQALRLETGISQPEALGLYKTAGFVEIGAFGDYAPDPLSVFMERPV